MKKEHTFQMLDWLASLKVEARQSFLRAKHTAEAIYTKWDGYHPDVEPQYEDELYWQAAMDSIDRMEATLEEGIKYNYFE